MQNHKISQETEITDYAITPCFENQQVCIDGIAKEG